MLNKWEQVLLAHNTEATLGESKKTNSHRNDNTVPSNLRGLGKLYEVTYLSHFLSEFF